jgi:hypothetical protein
LAQGLAQRLAHSELLVRAALNFELCGLGRPLGSRHLGGEGVALRLDLPGVGDKPVEVAGVPDQ